MIVLNPMATVPAPNVTPTPRPKQTPKSGPNTIINMMLICQHLPCESVYKRNLSDKLTDRQTDRQTFCEDGESEDDLDSGLTWDGRG